MTVSTAFKFDIRVTPEGHLIACETEADDAIGSDSLAIDGSNGFAVNGSNHVAKGSSETLSSSVSEQPTRRASDSFASGITAAFAQNQASGLFALAASRSKFPMTPAAIFWREFGTLYLTELCRTPEAATNAEIAVAPPESVNLEKILAGAPPMRGAEYLNVPLLERLWAELNRWVEQDLSDSEHDLGNWLKERAPLWHQVGRVCFHLAENKRDPDYPFAFLATYAPRVSQAGRVQYQPLSQALTEYAGEGNKKALINLLSPVHRASEMSSFIRALVVSNEIFHPLKWSSTDAYTFLKEVPVLEGSGVLVRVPDWWRKRARPRVSVTIGRNEQSRLGLDTLLDFKLELSVGDDRLSDAEIKQIQNAGNGLAYLKGQWIEIDQERLSEALSHWKVIEREAASGGISFVEGMRLLAGAPSDLRPEAGVLDDDERWSIVRPGEWLSEILTGLRDPGRLANAGQPDDLRGTLRPYQKTGHNWLWMLSNLGLGACLADDMGLGKTIQILSLLLSFKQNSNGSNAKPSLLVMPASLLSNWKSEIERFAPTLKPYFAHPSETGGSALSDVAKAPGKTLSQYDLVLTTYSMLTRLSWLQEIDWRLIILDEAQAIKNPSANQSQVVKKLRGDARIALTGTPVENRLSELWSLFDFLSPGLLGSASKFKSFVKALDEREHDRYLPLRNLVSPYILRRLKSDKTIIADLPDKTEMKVYCGLSQEQVVLYSQAVDELSNALKEVDGMKRRGLVLSFLTRFKQICNHPSHLLGDGNYGSNRSGKFERLKTICDEISSRQEKVLVFSQFKEMVDPLVALLTDIFGQSGLSLHGGTAVGKRKGIVDAFQHADGPPFMVLTVKAGGTGLNLTAASHVIHFDRWWNPAVENQATDRAYRIGQHRNVLVHKLICTGTIEEKIDQMIEDKKVLADDILAGAETILTELSDKELLDIVSLNIDKVNLD